MLFKLLYPLPDQFLVAVSGGVDSMSALYWLTNAEKRRVQGVVHFNHFTEHAFEAQELVRNWCKAYNIPFILGVLGKKLPKKGSLEHFYRNERYAFFDSVDPKDLPIVVAHHLDDCVEEYVACTMVKGFCGTIPYRRGRVIRPFRLWRKSSIVEYSEREKISYVQDKSNFDTCFRRNFIRHEILPNLFRINPGLYKIVEQAIHNQDEYNKVSILTEKCFNGTINSETE